MSEETKTIPTETVEKKEEAKVETPKTSVSGYSVKTPKNTTGYTTKTA